MGTCHLCWVIFICVGSGRRQGLKWFVRNLVTVLQSIQQPVCQTNISLLSKHCQTSDQCTHDGLSKKQSEMASSFDERAASSKTAVRHQDAGSKNTYKSLFF